MRLLQQLFLAKTVRGSQPADGRLVASERAGFVAAQHGHRGDVVQRAHACHQNAELRQLKRAERRGERERGRQRDRNGREQDSQHQRQHLRGRHTPQMSHAEN